MHMIKWIYYLFLPLTKKLMPLLSQVSFGVTILIYSYTQVEVNDVLVRFLFGIKVTLESSLALEGSDFWCLFCFLIGGWYSSSELFSRNLSPLISPPILYCMFNAFWNGIIELGICFHYKLIKCCHILSPLTDTHPSAIWSSWIK